MVKQEHIDEALEELMIKQNYVKMISVQTQLMLEMRDLLRDQLRLLNQIERRISNPNDSI